MCGSRIDAVRCRQDREIRVVELRIPGRLTAERLAEADATPEQRRRTGVRERFDRRVRKAQRRVEAMPGGEGAARCA
jgi:hypothetical protein